MNLTKLPEETLYSIAQVNAITGVAKPTIRFWEKEFRSFLHPQRTVGNQRRYSRTDIETIERINHLVRHEGYTLEGARRKLESEMAADAESPLANDLHLEKLADTMSDYLLKKLLAKSTA
ncbi:MAG: MerR family transcriptional regulator [Candidatus Zixiibacteriota bacterium]|nr:MAG: MerR family transcriptional regulator [candidate division Zixibacteria bacterium]